jgi:hypothetical protein
MSETEGNMPNASREAELTEKCRDLHRLVNLLFGGLVVTSFTLTAFLGLEAKRSGKLLSFRQQQVENTMSAVKQADAHDQAILSKLVEFARTHPDFQNKVLSKYKIAENPPAGAKK